MAAEHGDVAPMVARGLILLVGIFVLFIDDDQSEIGQWREDCRAGTDDDAGLPFADAVPFVEAFTL